jgi:phage terminase large subunit-like protein
VQQVAVSGLSVPELHSRVREAARLELEKRERLVAMKGEAERDLVAYVRMIWPIIEPATPLVEGWLLDCEADALMAVADGHLNRLCINVPPGAMKSTMLNVAFPSWLWGPQKRPYLRFISVSYSTDVPERDNLRFARVINHPVYRRCWGDQFNLLREGAGLVENNRTGWKRVSSTGGGVTGHRADYLLLDDLNNPGDVESDSVRGTTVKWVREIMTDRLNNLEESAIINIQQRTHENDATGTLIEHGQGYTFLCVPMEFDPLRVCSVVLRRDDDGEPEQEWTDPRALDKDGNMLWGLSTNERGEPKVEMGSPMAKAEGISCWPERFSEDVIASLKAEKGPYAWDSQYQQIPGVRGGSIIRREWWRLWEGPYPELGTIIVSLDTAVELKETNDYNAVTCWGAFAGLEGAPQFLLIDAWRERLPLAQLVAKVHETCLRRGADYLLIEHKTRGRDVFDELARLYGGDKWETVLVKPSAVDKGARLRAVEHLLSGDFRVDPVTKVEVYENGVVWAPDRDWADMVISECASFPYGAFDDLVDTVSQALGFARKNGVILRRPEYLDAETERQRYRKQISVPYSIQG